MIQIVLQKINCAPLKQTAHHRKTVRLLNTSVIGKQSNTAQGRMGQTHLLQTLHHQMTQAALLEQRSSAFHSFGSVSFSVSSSYSSSFLSFVAAASAVAPRAKMRPRMKSSRTSRNRSMSQDLHSKMTQKNRMITRITCFQGQRRRRGTKCSTISPSLIA